MSAISDKSQFKSFLSGLLFALVLVPILSPHDALAGDIIILTPPDKSTIYARRNYTDMVLKITDPSDVKKIYVEGKKNQQIETSGVWEKNGINYIHYRLPMEPGKNIYEIDPGDVKVHFNYKPLRSLLNVNLNAPSVYLFHRTEINPPECNICHDEKLPKDAKIEKPRYGPFSPVCFSCHRSLAELSTWRHGPVTSLFCRTCHQSDPAVDKIEIPLGKIDDLCYSCHMNQRRWKDMSHVHGPVGTGDCSVCHNPHGDKYRYQLWAEGEKALCVACHRDKLPLVQEDSPIFVHGILGSMGCVACHDPHATNYRYQLRSEIGDLCVSCHPQYAEMEKGHPVDKHPIKGEKDPRRSGHKFSCTSCHNPHGTRYQFMLIGELVGEQVCIVCHAKQKEEGFGKDIKQNK
ncbi:MAG: cytochrome c3 family protein [Proteobacteria bacterium]|nr:cytochrome c3 family protein [Pseudomonadota bacterium]MBU1711255.1 cytochrome c3 family protein [Pseudomonadota bacterium]